jgi:hypothetical protein
VSGLMTRNNTKIKLFYMILSAILLLFFIKRRRYMSACITLIITLVKASLSTGRVILPSIILAVYRSGLCLRGLSRRRGPTSGWRRRSWFSDAVSIYIDSRDIL